MCYQISFVESILTEDDDLDDLSCHANSVLHLQRVVSRVVDGGLTDDEIGVFAVAVDLDAVQAILQLNAAKGPGADGMRTGFDWQVEVNGFAAVHMNNLLRNAGDVDLGHHWDKQDGEMLNVSKDLLKQM